MQGRMGLKKEHNNRSIIAAAIIVIIIRTLHNNNLLLLILNAHTPNRTTTSTRNQLIKSLLWLVYPDGLTNYYRIIPGRRGVQIR